jgi:hypothetical protein
MIVIGLIIGAAAVVIWLAAYAAGVWFLQTRHLIDLNDPKAIATLLPLIPPAMATIATIATAGTTAVVALINRRAQLDLARTQNTYVQELEQKKLQYNKELEEKKKSLSAELEHEKIKLDIFKSEINRQLTLVNRAFSAVSPYAASLRKIRHGDFDKEDIEEAENEIRNIAVEWDRNSELFKVWQGLLRGGVYLKEKAERRPTSEGLKKLWTEVEDGTPLGVRFGELQERVLLGLRNERDRIFRLTHS